MILLGEATTLSNNAVNIDGMHSTVSTTIRKFNYMNTSMKFREQIRLFRRSEEGFNLIELMVCIIIIGILGAGAIGMMAMMTKDQRPEDQGTPEPENTPVTPPVSSAPAPDFPVGFVFGTLLAIVLLGGIIWASIVIFRKAADVSRAGEKNLSGWKTLADHHAKIRSEWMAYETDILKIVDFPILSDMSEPVTIKLHEALRKASLHEPKNIKSLKRVPFNGSDYDVAVQDLDTAFRAAESKARLTSWSKFTEDEKKRLRRAKDLLAMAMDGDSTSSERQVAYKQAIKTLKGLIEVPKATILALESTTQLALTA